VVIGIIKDCLCDELVYVRFGGLTENLAFEFRRLNDTYVEIEVINSDEIIKGKMVSVGTEMIHLDIGFKRMTLPFSAVYKVFNSDKKLIYEFKQNEEHIKHDEVNEKK
jgi:hypothetical protein